MKFNVGDIVKCIDPERSPFIRNELYVIVNCRDDGLRVAVDGKKTRTDSDPAKPGWNASRFELVTSNPHKADHARGFVPLPSLAKPIVEHMTRTWPAGTLPKRALR